MGDVEGERPCLRGGGCGATVRWVLTVNHRRLDLDVDPDTNGTVIIVELDGRIRARVLTGVEMPAQQQAFRMHRCPPKRERPGPACAGCQLPMPRDLAITEGWTHHPSCEPAFLLRLAQDRLRERKPRR